YDLSRRHHPDFQQAESPEVQARALEQSALVNTAYRTLRDPIARIEYLVRLEEGRETREGSPVKPKAPPELLQEMFEVQEMLEEAKAGGLDASGRNGVAAERERLAARCREEEERLTGSLAAEWDAAPTADRPRLVTVLKDVLARRAYLRTVIDDLDAALAEPEDSDVTHHRH
ncbi:MAG TPA: Fe-S protein assembly co-chaperone HscB, partial [Methylomirabilota bacterium]|nr:Fe-S protein assembly co-chaperone HscB [Methylomirabilota bacterium]